MTSALPAIQVPEEHQFLTVLEVAQFLRVAKMTVYRMVKTKELDSITVGRSIRIPRATVNQYLESRKNTS